MDEFARTPITGAVLHRWLGDRTTTSRALDLGTYFSINAATVRRSEALDLVPTDRLLPETDHPDGNRSGARPRQPGNVDDIESSLAEKRGLSAAEFRLQTWKNLASLTTDTNTKQLLPVRIAAIIDAAASSV